MTSANSQQRSLKIILKANLLHTIFIGLIFSVVAIYPTTTMAAGISIKHGGSLSLVEGGRLNLDCHNLLLQSGGKFTLDGGNLVSYLKIIKEEGSLYLYVSGKVKKCGTYVNPAIYLLLNDD